jgi:hypothetical protein
VKEQRTAQYLNLLLHFFPSQPGACLVLLLLAAVGPNLDQAFTLLQSFTIAASSIV